MKTCIPYFYSNSGISCRGEATFGEFGFGFVQSKTSSSELPVSRSRAYTSEGINVDRVYHEDSFRHQNGFTAGPHWNLMLAFVELECTHWTSRKPNIMPKLDFTEGKCQCGASLVGLVWSGARNNPYIYHCQTT